MKQLNSWFGGSAHPVLAEDPMYLDGHRNAIVAWVAQGLSDREIAERVRVSPSTVRYWRERNGVKRPARVPGPKRHGTEAGERG